MLCMLFLTSMLQQQLKDLNTRDRHLPLRFFGMCRGIP